MRLISPLSWSLGRTAVAVMALALTARAAPAREELAVLEVPPAGPHPGDQFEHWLKGELHRLIDQRTAAMERVKSVAEARAWQAERREFFLRQIGGLPERTPLNARVTGTLQGRGYRVEKIIFESRPGFHVTANLYLPETPPPWPAVLVPCGHSANGKAWPSYQRTCILLARHGMAALIYDPVGQGERYQMLDATGGRTHFHDAPGSAVPHPLARYTCTIEHTALGLGGALVGVNAAQFLIWDGIRAIDYLQSRPDIRGDRIGCAGQSGGGTQTAYLMALDERIAAAVPVGYLTTFRRIIESVSGPQDGEQNLFGQLRFGLDQADFVNLRAPRPTLISTGTREVTFNIHGTWDLFRESKRFYSRLGHAERVEIHETDAPHSMSLDHREAIARWMHRWLLGEDRAIREVESRPDPMTDAYDRSLSVGDWTDEQLQCTPQGQVRLLPGARSAFAINAALADGLQAGRAAAWAKLSGAERRRLIRETLNLREMDALPEPAVETVGKLERDGYTIHKLVLTAAPGLRLPALAFVPARETGGVTLYLHGNGMKADAAPGGPIEALVRQGQVVLAAELRGLGETAPRADRPHWSRGALGTGVREFLLASLMGESLVGLRANDLQLWTRFLGTFPPARLATKIQLVAQGGSALPALHVAATTDRFASVTLIDMVRSWEDLVQTAEPARAEDIVHGALRRYTLADLIEETGASRVQRVRPVSPADR